MQTKHEDNGRPERDEYADLARLFRQNNPSYSRVNVDAVLREASAGAHGVVADTWPVGGHLKTHIGGVAEGGELVSLFQRRTIMLKRMGVMGACAASICVALALGLWGSNSALAQVQDALRKVQTASYTVAHNTGGNQQITWRVKCIAEDLCRLEQPNGIYLVFDVKAKRVMEVNPNESKVRFIENIPVPKNFNIISKLANVKVLAVKNEPGLPNREIGGKETTGFVIEENGVQFNVWIDPATNLPLEMERRLPSTGQRIESSSTEKWTRLSSMEKWTDFRFDEPLDKTLFALEVPEGFAVDTRNSATQEWAPESYGFGQEVKPKAKQE